MIRPFIFFFLIVSFASAGQKNIPLGIGLIKINQERVSNLWFFSDTSSIKPTRTVTISRTGNGSYFFKNSNELEKWFSPEAIKLDYYVFYLRVDTIIGNWIRVIVNNDKGDMYWTKAEPSKKFMPWTSFLKQITGIEKIDDFNLEIKSQPGDSAKTIKKFEASDCLQIVSAKGDWIEVRTINDVECENSRAIKSGWIRWRLNGHLTIGYTLLC